MSKLPRKYQRRAIEIKWALLRESERSNWDRRNQDGEQYCIHGTNIGTWWGADYMCGYCEADWTITQFALSCAWQEYELARKRADSQLIDFVLRMRTETRASTESVREALQDKLNEYPAGFFVGMTGAEILSTTFGVKL